MNLRSVENIINFLKNSKWNSISEHDNALEVALSKNKDDIFKMITRNTNSPLIYESGCCSGISTIQICNYFSNRGIVDYKLIGHDVREYLVKYARKRFIRDNRISIELRGGSDYEDIPNESVDGIFSFNTMIPFLNIYYNKERNYSQHEDYLQETAKILKDGKPLILTYLRVSLILTKDTKREGIPFQIKFYDKHDCIKPFLKLLDPVELKNNQD